jgi:hypothetical protein
VNGKQIGTTGSGGAIAFSLDAPSGKVLRIATECPAEYRSPDEEVPLRLRRIESIDSPQGGALHVATRCLPRRRKTAIVVRTPGFSDLPVLMHGAEVARTDDQGTAHILLALAPGSEVKLKVDTSSNPYLQPHSPSETLTVGDIDDVFVFNPDLVERRPKPKRRKAKAKRTIVKVKSLHSKPWERR